MKSNHDFYVTGVNQGYRDGQLDLLDYLRGVLDEVHADIELEVRLWNLGQNLMTAGALKQAELNGKAAATSWNTGGGYRKATWEDPHKWREKQRLVEQTEAAAKTVPSKPPEYDEWAWPNASWYARKK